MKKPHPAAKNLGDYLHPAKGSKINAPMAKPMQPMAQRTPSTPKAPMKMMPAKMKIGKGKK